MKMDIFEKRSDLIIDYLSQILVYGSTTKGTICIDAQAFEDGEFLILTVHVLKNSYFRWHDLGIKQSQYQDFYSYLYERVIKKFEKFSLNWKDNELIIKSDVNGNQVFLHFSIFDSLSNKFLDTLKCKL